MAMQQHVVEHDEHDKAQQKSWSSIVSRPSSRCPDTVLPLAPARSGRKCEVDCAPLPHYNPIHSACHLNQQHTVSLSIHMQVIQKPCCDGRAAKQQVRKHWKLYCGPAHSRLGSVWSLSLRTKQYGEFGSRTERLSRPF